MGDLIESTVAVITRPDPYHEGLLDPGLVLLLKRADVGEDMSLHGKWGFPGGKIEPGETPHEAIVRECVEEIGIPLSQHVNLGTGPAVLEFEPYRIHAWHGYVLNPFRVILSPEHTAFRWIAPGHALVKFAGQIAGPGTEALLWSMRR
jgi:8-oxo-dGTP diphosphatase